MKRVERSARNRLNRAALGVQSAQAERCDAVQAARDAGLSWREIGSELGMSPEGARRILFRELQA